MTRSGSAYVLPTLAHLTAGSASSSLLPTPDVSSGQRSAESHERGGHQVSLQDITHLLPTPTASPYGNNQSASPGAAVRPSLDSLATDLLPTPQARDWKGEPGPAHRNGGLTRALGGLLPTPIASDASASGKDAPNRTDGPKLSTLLLGTDELLPTVTAMQPKRRGQDRSDELLLAGVVETLLPTVRAVQGETRNHTIYERPDSPVNNLETALAPLLPTPMAMIEDSKSPEYRKDYGHGSYFSDLPHLLGVETEPTPPRGRTSRQSRPESTSVPTDDLFSDGS